MKKVLMLLLETTLSMIYVAAVYHISMSTPILAKINYNGSQYIEYSLKSFIFFGAAVGIYVFAQEIYGCVLKRSKVPRMRLMAFLIEIRDGIYKTNI